MKMNVFGTINIYHNPDPQVVLYINSAQNHDVVIGAPDAQSPADLIVQGNISIGTPVGANTPRFSVDGNAAFKGMICAQEVRVRPEGSAPCWPDYVFDNSYRLMPLQELRNYVGTHKHLPGIPTAATVTDEGFAVGEMNRLLVEKGEELTRYILELDTKIKALENLKK